MKNILMNKAAGQELRLKHKRGKVSPYFWRGSIIEMNGENVFLNIGLNITEQKKMEKELVEQKQLADAIINSLPGTFFMLNEKLNYVRVNRNFVKEIGYSEKELKSLTPFSFMEGKDKERVQKNIEEVRKYGESSVEVSPKTKTGEIKHRYVKSVLFELEDETFIIGTGNDVSELKKREKMLEVTIQEKNVLLQEIHHRVKNNLAVISGLLELQAYEYDDPKLKRIVKESQMRIQTMAMIHEKLYQSQNLSRISILEYIDDLISQIKGSIKYGAAQITIETEIDDIELNINQAIPFALSLNEIISNALEHAFFGKEKGKLRVQLLEKGGTLYSTISDNGIGFEEGEDPSQKNSLGFTLIKALLSQIDANWTVDGSDGVTYHISFKKDKDRGSSSALTVN
jgi:PAS domain S-box-containing protein